MLPILLAIPYIYCSAQFVPVQTPLHIVIHTFGLVFKVVSIIFLVTTYQPSRRGHT